LLILVNRRFAALPENVPASLRRAELALLQALVRGIAARSLGVVLADEGLAPVCRSCRP
jgi:hypothetical protein